MSNTTPLFRIPLIRELALVLFIKLMLIVLIRTLFFSDPVRLEEPEQDIARQLGISFPETANNASRALPESVTIASQQEDHHDQ